MYYQIRLSTINLLEFYGLLNEFIKECSLSTIDYSVNTNSTVNWSRSIHGKQYMEIYDEDTLYKKGPIFNYKDFIFNEGFKKI